MWVGPIFKPRDGPVIIDAYFWASRYILNKVMLYGEEDLSVVTNPVKFFDCAPIVFVRTL